MTGPRPPSVMRAAARSALTGLALLLLAGSAGAGTAPSAPAPVDRAQLARATSLAADYLLAQVQPDGSFVYRINVDPAVEVRRRYNWLRHAGTLYSLADYYQVSKKPHVATAITRAANHMRTTAMAPVTRFPGAWAVWTDPKVTGSKPPGSAKLGGAGLGLVALTALQDIIPRSVPARELAGLARFIVAMQKPDGSYYSKYIPDRGGPNDDWVSLYYPGEAALGLTMLYEQDGNRDWLDGARKTLHFLSASRKGQAKVPADHWALIATARLWPHLGEADRAVFRRHARQVVNFMLSEQVWEAGSIANGGFTPDGRTTPTATRLEGLLAAEFLFRDEPAFHRSIHVAITWGMRFMLRAQIQQGRYKGGVRRAIARIRSSHPDATKFNRRATEIRIDYVQHALSAFIQFRKFQDLMAR